MLFRSEDEVNSGGEEARDGEAARGGADVTAGSGVGDDEDEDMDEHIQVEESSGHAANLKAESIAQAKARRAAATGEATELSTDE